MDPAHQLQIVRQFDREGLPLRAHTIASDPRGFLWVAADTGLYRFDGLHFERVDGEPAAAVQITADGWIWVGGSSGLARFRDGRRVPVISGPVTALLSLGAAVAVSGDRLRYCRLSGCESFPVTPNGGLVSDGKGGAWFACGGAVCRFTSHRIDRFQPPLPESHLWLDAARDEDGNLWAWDLHSTLRWRPGSDPVFYDWPPTEAGYDQLTALRTPEGSIRLSGASISHGRISALDSPLNDRHDRPQFQEDFRGNLWESSPAGGLAMFSPRSWIYGWGTAVFPNGCKSVSGAQDSILASCGTGVFAFSGYYGKDQNDWKLLPGTEVGVPALAALASPGAGLWSILASRGIVNLDAHGRETKAAWRGVRPIGLDFRSLFRSRDGRVWVGAKGGLFRLDTGVGRLIPEPLPGGYRYATAFATGPDGREWLGFDGGIARLGAEPAGGRWELVVPREALLNPGIRSIAVSSGPVFWISYRSPLAFSRLERVGGQWKRRDFSAEDGFGPSETRSLFSDSRGWIWRATPEGLFVCDGVHLEAADWVQLHTVNNLPSDSSGPYAFFENRAGSLWMVTDGGVADIHPDPAWFRTEQLPPPRVTSLRWHGQTLLWPSSGDRLHDPGGDLRIDFAQWPSAVPRPAGLRFRLLPVESAWRAGDAGAVTYPTLKSGEYRFEIRARGLPDSPYEFRVEDSVVLWPYTGTATLAGIMTFLVWRKSRHSFSRAAYWKEKEAFLASHVGASDAPELHSGETVAGRYVIGERIGQGGFATVWKGADAETGTAVAVKFLNAQGEIEDWQVSRFYKETEALSRIDHPGVVRLLDSGRSEDGGFWLAMAWVSGPDIRAVLKSGPVGRSTAAGWIRQVGAALSEAHCSGVLHRDLKPENILIEHWRQPDERVVVVDFGAAAVESGPGQQSALHLGSFDYMAPERVQGRSSTATDVYGLAAVAFELLTGVRYAGVAAKSIQSMRRLLAGLPEEVADVLTRGLSYVPEERPPDIRAFAEELAALLEEA